MGSQKHFIQYNIFKPNNNIIAFTTTIQTISSDNARYTGDIPDVYGSNRKQLAETLGVKINQLVFPRQTHTNCVVEVNKISSEEISETDALITDNTGICICIQTADCVPILLADPVKKVVAAVHAGWRGTVKKIVEGAINKMVNNKSCSPENILAAVGPSISPEIYEVGIEVVQDVRKHIPNPEKTLMLNGSGKYHLDLWEANRQVMLECGLKIENIEILGECSFQNSDKYYSARRDGINTGRMVSGIMLTS